MRRSRSPVLAIAVCVAFVAGGASAGPPAEIGAVDGSGASTPGVAAQRLRPPGRSFSIAAVGDWLSEGLVNNAAAAAAPAGVRYDHEPLLRPIASIISAADLAICHMETPIGLPGATAGFIGRGPTGTSLIAAPYEVAADLKRVGFDRCSTASNHSYDLGTNGITQTLDALDAAGLTHTGTARSAAEAAPQLFDVKGVKVAHLSFARNSNVGFPSDWWRVRQGVNATNVINDVARARAAGAEVVIVSLHVFIEMQNAPTAEDRAIVQQIVNQAKPDLILIHGPHVPQPVERVGGTLAYWSMGNFISGMGAPGRNKYSDLRTLDGLMATVRFTQQPNGSWLTEPWTVLLCNATGSRKVYPGVSALFDPAVTGTLRAQMQACVSRASKVVADLR
jgi:poly-gamma-glutamate capsule biosynthesis protein CapA/YwtB (metallophosphatase superfamily)